MPRRGWSAVPLPACPWIVVDLERRLFGTPRLGYMLQVHPDAVPERARAAHAVDEHVGRLEQLHHVGMLRLPLLEPLERLGLRLRSRDLDERHRGLAPSRAI